MEQFTFVKRGYDPEEVDKYITTLEQVIKSYKDKDNAIKNAIISAQRTAEDVVKNAQAEAESYKAQMGEQLVGMRGALDRQRASLQNLKSINANAIRKCMQELEQFDMTDMFSRIDEMDAAIAALQGLEAVNKDRLMQSQNQIHGGMPRDAMAMHDVKMMREPEPRREHGYMPRESAPPMPMRDTGREMHQNNTDPYGTLREPRDARMLDTDRPIRETMRDTGMDMMRTRPAPPPMAHEPMRDTGRDVMAREQHYAPPPEPMREPMPMRETRDMMPREQYAPAPIMRETRDAMGREEVPPYAPHGAATGREMMRQPSPPPAGYSLEPSRELIRDTRPRSDIGRDIRRDYGRDMRSDSNREVRDYTGGLGRLDGREPMREMPRPYAPDANNYDDQNLLPPVASLM